MTNAKGASVLWQSFYFMLGISNVLRGAIFSTTLKAFFNNTKARANSDSLNRGLVDIQHASPVGLKLNEKALLSNLRTVIKLAFNPAQ